MRPDQVLWQEAIERLGYHYRLEYPSSIKLQHEMLLASVRHCECGKTYVIDHHQNDADRFIDRLIAYRKIRKMDTISSVKH